MPQVASQPRWDMSIEDWAAEMKRKEDAKTARKAAKEAAKEAEARSQEAADELRTPRRQRTGAAKTFAGILMAARRRASHPLCVRVGFLRFGWRANTFAQESRCAPHPHTVPWRCAHRFHTACAPAVGDGLFS